MRGWIKQLVPPVLFRAMKRLFNPQWVGDFSDWNEVSRLCRGYSQQSIVDHQIRSQRKVLNGEAAFERDGYLFAQPEINFPFMSAMLMASRDRESISVLDFGGALGSTYVQHSSVFKSQLQSKVYWSIVEQPIFVKAGKNEFQSDSLKFFETIQDAAVLRAPDLIFSSSTLQYLESPEMWIKELTSLGAPYLFLDRIAFNGESKKRLTLQKVPRNIYEASYPCWFFNESDFLKLFQDSYELIWSFHNSDQADIPSYFKGFFFRRKS